MALGFYNPVVRPATLLLPAILLALLASRPAAAEYVVTLLDAEEPARGISIALEDGKLVLQVGEGPARTFDAGTVISVDAVPPPPSRNAPAGAFEVELVDGSVLHGVPQPANAGVLGLRSRTLKTGDGDLVLPIESLWSLRRGEGIDPEAATRMLRIEGQDATYRLDGGRVTGVVEGFEPVGVVIDRGAGSAREVPWDELAALFVDNERLPIPQGLHCVARLADGSRLVLTGPVRIQGGLLTGTTPSGLDARVSLDDVAAVGFRGGGFVHLSDLVAAAVIREPVFPIPEGPNREALLDFVCPVRMDRSPDNAPIEVARVRYDKGLGVRPRTTLRYTLDGAYREFRALCGIDDEVLGTGYGQGGGTGSVVFEVHVDGERRWRSPVVNGGKPAIPVRIDVAQAKTLELVVRLVPDELMPEGASDTPELDNAVWARPLLVR